jgi:hypothetical protein
MRIKPMGWQPKPNVVPGALRPPSGGGSGRGPAKPLPIGGRRIPETVETATMGKPLLQFGGICFALGLAVGLLAAFLI